MDKKFHVAGDLMITPISLFQPIIKEADCLIADCGQHSVWIMEVIPLLLLIPCCSDTSHCAHIRGSDANAYDATENLG